MHVGAMYVRHLEIQQKSSYTSTLGFLTIVTMPYYYSPPMSVLTCHVSIQDTILPLAEVEAKSSPLGPHRKRFLLSLYS